MPDRTKVRTTIEPDREIEVGLVELNDLRRLGLLVAAPPAPAPVVEARPRPKADGKDAA